MIIDITIVDVAAPAIITDLGATATQAQWVQEAYTLVFAALLLTSGRIGGRRMLVIGIGVFVAAGVLAARAPTAELLIAARVLQGVGGSAIFPGNLSLINATFTGASAASRSRSGAPPSAGWPRSGRCRAAG